MATYPTNEFEERLKGQGYTSVVGVDEVGRGAWAGPLVACACVLNKDFTSKDLRDSKQLTQKQRERLAEEIKASCRGFGIGTADPYEIDLFGLTQATQLAFRRALNDLKCSFDYILSDGFVLECSRVPCEGIIKGDEKIVSVAAASVIAKVTRDHMMRDYAKKYPDYGFDHNVGYGTKEHLAQINKLGFLPIHRKLFVRNVMSGLPIV